MNTAIDNPLRMVKTLLDALPDPVLLVGEDRVVVAANLAAKELLGNRIEDRDLAMALRHPTVLDAVGAVLAGKTSGAAEISVPGPIQRDFALHVASLIGAGTEPARAILVLRDITAAKAAEKMRADFVANVSHELRSPLAALSGFIETLKGPAKDDTAARTRFLDIMEGESGRMARLIDDLLSLSKVEADEHVRPQDEVDLRGILEEVADSLTPLAKKQRVKIELDCAKESLAVYGERDELVEVFQNLIFNAINYGRGDTSVRVVARVVDRAPDLSGRGVAVAVEDQGEGIAAEHLPRLTERFYRVDKGRSRRRGGTGLGLAIVKHIVNRHRGRLTIESTPGKGSTFTVFLPASDGRGRSAAPPLS